MAEIETEINEIRPMTDEEMEGEMWSHVPDYQRPTVIELADGTILFPSQDPEGNGPGALFGQRPGGKGFRFG